MSDLQVDYEWLLEEACYPWTYANKKGVLQEVHTFDLPNFKGRDLRVDFVQYKTGSYANVRVMGKWDGRVDRYSHEASLDKFWLDKDGIPRDIRKYMEKPLSSDKQEVNWREVWACIHSHWLMKELNDELAIYIRVSRTEVA